MSDHCPDFNSDGNVTSLPDYRQLAACEMVDVWEMAVTTGLDLGVYHTTHAITDKTTNTIWEVAARLFVTGQPPVYVPAVLR